jgi:subtilisin family serine protease
MLVVVAAASAALLAPAGAQAALPDDPLFSRQWPLARADVLGAPEAWQQTTGAGALVALLDTGADLAHPDLAGALWTNPDEIAGNGADDDRDGYVDDVHGADVVNGDGDPSDDEGHGTHVAGIVAARAGNGIGGTGLAPDAQVMIVKVLDEHRAGNAGDLAAGIRYALAHGARIINTSINGEGASLTLRRAIAEATAAGALIVASAGNDQRDIDVLPSYPAAYPDASVLTVAAAGQDGALAGFSNRGLLAVDLAAPGADILSTARGGGYELRSGTSMAAPLVSATLALMQSARPGLDGPALREALLGAARRSGPLAGLLAAGALDTAAALRAVVPVWKGSSLPASLRVLQAARRRGGATVRWVLDGDGSAIASVRVLVDGRLVAEPGPVAQGRLAVRARPGRHRVLVQAFDASGAVVAEAAGTFLARV